MQIIFLWEKYKKYRGIETEDVKKIAKQDYHQDGSGKKQFTDFGKAVQKNEYFFLQTELHSLTKQPEGLSDSKSEDAYKKFSPDLHLFIKTRN
nr:hypothetical protein [Lebetimonas sp. JH292]